MRTMIITAGHELDPNCKDEVVSLLKEILLKAARYNHDRESGLNAEMNALVTKNAENYYRAMSSFRDYSCNERDLHMVETLNSLIISWPGGQGDRLEK